MKLVHRLSFLPSASIFLAVIGPQQASGHPMYDPLEFDIHEEFGPQQASGHPMYDPLEFDINEECSSLSLYNYDANPFNDCNPPYAHEVLGSQTWKYFRSGRTSTEQPELEPFINELKECGVLPVNDKPEFSVSCEANDDDNWLTTTTSFETTKTEKKCGPDITDWLVKEMNTNKDHRVIKTNRDNDWAMWIPGFNIGWHAGFLIDFKNLVKAGAVWDYKATQDFSSANCPRNCPDTVTLCGICFFYDVPGNIHYGWVGRAGRIRAWFLHNRAAAAQAGGVDDPKDTAAINIGINLWDGGGGNICTPIRAAQANLATRDCPTCGDKFPLAGKPKRKKPVKKKNRV